MVLLTSHAIKASLHREDQKKSRIVGFIRLHRQPALIIIKVWIPEI